MLKYAPENISHAKALRKTMTPWERKLWYEFLRMYPIKFYRQKAIGHFIVDFFCSKATLVIELDGSGHYNETTEIYDQTRTERLNQLNLEVLRFTNLEIDQHFQAVCHAINLKVEARMTENVEQEIEDC